MGDNGRIPRAAHHFGRRGSRRPTQSALLSPGTRRLALLGRRRVQRRPYLPSQNAKNSADTRGFPVPGEKWDGRHSNLFSCDSFQLNRRAIRLVQSAEPCSASAQQAFRCFVILFYTSPCPL